MAERYFKREEAEELLPVIASYLQQVREQKQKMDSLDKELAQAAARVMMLGGSRPPYRTLAKKKVEREQLERKLQQAVAQIQETGCLVKDLDEGLVDFPCLREGEEVYLCWKLGEERIGYWHRIHEGFAGRKPLGDRNPPNEPPKDKGSIQ